jgi:hypothetical protein
MIPGYFIENRYSFVANIRAIVAGSDYETESPESSFERSVQQKLAEAHAHAQNEEYALALDAYSKLRALILKTAHPTLPVSQGPTIDWKAIAVADVFQPLVMAAGHVLRATPAPASSLPDSVVSARSLLPDAIQQLLRVHDGAGLDGRDVRLPSLLTAAEEAASHERWEEARELLEEALGAAPADDQTVVGHVAHDLALALEKADRIDEALATASKSVEAFESSGDARAHFDALVALNGIQRRSGKLTEAGETEARATTVASAAHLFPLLSVTATSASNPASAALGAIASRVPPNGAAIAVRLGTAVRARPGGAVERAAEVDDVAEAIAADKPTFSARAYLSEARAAKSVSIVDSEGAAHILSLGDDMAASFDDFYRKRATTLDLELLDGQRFAHTTFVAYLPHVYFFVLPMAMGDCHGALGDFAQAEEMYLSVLAYPTINQAVEVPKLWMRLADLYLDWGGQLYRAAGSDTSAFGPAREKYERVIRADGTIDANSPLYRDAKFGGVRGRAQAVASAGDPLTLTENPAIVARILRARAALGQMDADLNYFGFAADYIPPFAFEYLQNAARYLAQQAARAQQQYIQFKSQAENEEFRRDQLDQQAEIARASVELERRNLAETEAGIGVAQASVNYAETQRQNAIATRNDFNAVRWELLEIAELEAWAASASNDEVKLTTSGLGYTYYNVTDRKRSWVLYDLARRRTLISHNIEANRLQREINSAQAYKNVAEAQLRQAQARRASAEQRVAIAQLQQRFAEENRNFLDLREFSARTWYELAREARRLVRRNLDMAIETAFLMERAYDAETGRNLARIRFDYGPAGQGINLGAEGLVADIDSFTLDYVRTRSKKAHIKQVISLADEFPMAFNQLKQSGRALFETTLEQFDRDYPGFYLHKVKNVELQFVGLTSGEGIRGTLRNIGTSNFRKEDGSIATLVYPADVMPLSEYELRTDALAFRFNESELRLFENNGVATMWQIEFPVGANDVPFDQVLDARLVLYYDAFFDAALESTVRAGLPTTGEGARGVSMRLFVPDELFYLRSQGTGELAFDAGMFPGNQENLVRQRVVVQATGDAATTGGLTLRLTSSDLAAERQVPLDAQGLADSDTTGSPLADLVGRPVSDTWTITIDPADNPSLVQDGRLVLAGLRDLAVFLEYSFDYRS